MGPPGFGHVISLISVWFHGAVYHREASQQRAGNGADGVSGPRRVPAAPGVGGGQAPRRRVSQRVGKNISHGPFLGTRRTGRHTSAH